MQNDYGPSFTESLPSSVVGFALPASLVGRSRGSLMAPHADTCFDISLVIPPRERFLIP